MARTLAEERNAKLSAFEAVPPLVFSSQPWRAEYEVERRVTSAQERVDRLRGVEGHAGFGPADSELANFGQGLGLLVLGPHEHDDVPSGGRTLAQRLAGGAPCPLLVLALPRHPE